MTILCSVCRKSNIQYQSKKPSPATLECRNWGCRTDRGGCVEQATCTAFCWGEVKPLDDSSTYFRKIRPNSKFCLQQGRILQMFLTCNAGGAGYRMELVISADKDKKFTPIPFFSPGFLQTSSEQESPMQDNHVQHHSRSENTRYRIPCRYRK